MKAIFLVWKKTSTIRYDLSGLAPYEDIRQGKPGQYRVSLLQTSGDGVYPGIHLLPDNTIVVTSSMRYTDHRKEVLGSSIVRIRFKIDEIDAIANAAVSLTPPGALYATGKAGEPDLDQFAGIDLNESAETPVSPDWAALAMKPPVLIPNPGGTKDHARASRTCSGVPSSAVSRGGCIWVAWWSGKTPGEIVERCPNVYVCRSGHEWQRWA